MLHGLVMVQSQDGAMTMDLFGDRGSVVIISPIC
jgi:hypothetical protein